MSGDVQRSAHFRSQAPVLITGGAGFIGTNLADRLLGAGNPVVVFDNLSRAGVEQNLRWLRERHPDLLRVQIGDMRDAAAVQTAVHGVGQVFHLAAQVAVTTSLIDPLQDFEINARGTLNLLEAMRAVETPPSLVYTSTNKVYGQMADVALKATRTRYEPVDREEAAYGFDERRTVQFHSPYGCSKGAADQYVLDYAHTFGFEATVFRMSCIYGPHQFGNEDQGWVAHFLIRSLLGQSITLYGDGKQVRDILYVDDLVDALLLAQENIGEISGTAFNLGGGGRNTTSLLELMDLIAELNGEKPEVCFDAWRAADQRYYVSDTRAFARATGWKPRVNVQEGVTRLFRWLGEHRLKANRPDTRSRRSSLLPTPALGSLPIVAR